MSPHAATLGQVVASSQSNVATILIAVGALLALAIVGAMIWTWLRRRLFHDTTDIMGEPLTLSQLRQMRADGDISEEEFERTKATLVAQLRGSAAPTPPTNVESSAILAEPGFDLAGDPLPPGVNPTNNRGPADPPANPPADSPSKRPDQPPQPPPPTA